MEAFLPLIWFFIMGVTLVLFIILDGADLGIGVLSLGATEARRATLLDAIGPLWYANETWLVIADAIMFGAFPRAYSVIFSSMYIPAMMLIFGLMFRAVSIEFLDHSQNKRLWGYCLGAGSLLAIVGHGLLLGGLLTNINVAGGSFAGGPWDWLNPMSILIAMGTVAGYIMLGASFLVNKVSGDTGAGNWRVLQASSWVAYGFFVLAVILIPLVRTPTSEMWIRQLLRAIISGRYQYIYIIPALLLVAIFGFVMIFFSSARRTDTKAPYVWSIVLLLSVAAAIIAVIFPFLIPFSITINDAASSTTSLIFMLYGAGAVLPIVIIYNLYVRKVFGGKVKGKEKQSGY
ncbi:MAG: cytochrome d ubiquinol oxidase subunit II [Dehalococcoidia bacterium]|jgi:cytochrome d ubiquinol oxidase subunit II